MKLAHLIEERKDEKLSLVPLPSEQEAEYILKHLELHEQRLEEMRKKIKKESKTDENMKRLQGIAGVGPIVAYAFVAHVGDGSRFSKGAQVSNYLGFVPRLDYSGTIQRHGHISKRGNAYLRGLLVQAAWSTVRSKSGGALRERYKYKTAGQGTSKKKTIVSIGRRLAEIMYSVLRNKTEYEPRQWKGVINKTNDAGRFKCCHIFGKRGRVWLNKKNPAVYALALLIAHCSRQLRWRLFFVNTPAPLFVWNQMRFLPCQFLRV
jgi:hypothetical protein